MSFIQHNRQQKSLHSSAYYRRIAISGKISFPLLLWMCILFIAVSLLITFYGQHVRQQTLELLDVRLSSQAHLRINALKEPIDNLQRNARFLTSVPPVQGIVRATLNNGFDAQENSALETWQNRLSRIFVGFATAHPDVIQIRFIGVADGGKELLKIDRSAGQILLSSPSELQSKDTQKFFQKTIQLKQGEVYISDIHLNRENNQITVPHLPIIIASTPVFSSEGKLFGIIVINAKADGLMSALNDNLFKDFKAYLTNSDGDYLQSPNPTQNFGFDLGTRYRWQDHFTRRSDSSQDITHIQSYDYKDDSNTSTVHVYTMSLPLDTYDQHRGLKLHILISDSLVSYTVTERLKVLVVAILGSALLMGRAFVVYLRQRRKTQIAQARFAAMVESSNDAIIGLSLDGIVTSWNKSAELLFGYSANQALTKNENELCFSQISSADETYYQGRVHRGQTVANIQTKYQQKNGNSFDASITMAPIYNSNKLVIGVAKTIRDITEQKLAEQQIRQLNESLEQQVVERTEKIETFSQLQHAILKNAGIAMIATDPNGHITLFNPAAERMLGYRAEEMIGQSPAKFHDGNEVAAYEAELSAEFGELIEPGFAVLIARSLRGLPNEREWTYIQKNGTGLPVYLTVTALRNKNKFVTGFLVMAMDISQQKLDRINLQSLTDHLNKAIKVSELGTWSWHLHDNKHVWNDRMKEMYSVPADASPDSYHVYWYSSIHPEDLADAMNAIQRAIEGLEPFNATFRVVKADGSIRYMNTAGLLEMGSDDKPSTMSGFNRDITTQFEHEASLQEAMVSANAANLAKSVFLANMSHEIRTPMNAILGMQQLLHRTELDGRQLDYVAKTETAALALLSILNDILDFSKVEAGKLILEKNTFNFDKLLRDVGVILAANIGQKDVEVLFDIDPNSPAWIIGDAMRLQQVLINIAGNAVKFTDVGEIIVTVRFVKATATMIQPQLSFSIRDSGIGIAPEAQQSIFDGFSQAEPSTARRYGGSGLGLAISQRLVRLMGGDIGFESVLGVGSNFHFSIPCTAVDGLELPTATAVAELKGLRVLVIDDNHYARQILASMVVQFGWIAHEAVSGIEALTLLKKAKYAGDDYDVVFVDWRMPEMDGWETTEHLRQLYADSIAPLIVMVTAADRSKTTEQQQQLSSQLDGFLVKPITASMLFDAVADARTGRNAMSVVKKINTTHQRLVGVRILVVEDNLTNQQVEYELLSAEGAVVTVADNGLAAIKAVVDTRLDVVLMDIQMPDMDGYTATREIRKSISKEILPIIALTANALATDRAAAIEAGMNDHVGKPFDLTQLVTVISSQISRIVDTETVISSPLDSTIVNQSKLDVQGALERFGYNQNIYANALLNFGHDTSAFLTQLSGLVLTDITQSSDELQQSKNEATLRRILHALKGLSGTIGAKELATIIANAEKFSMQEFVKEWFDLKLLIEQTIQQAERSAHQMNILSAAKHVPSDPTQLEKRPALTELESFSLLLRDSNMQALNEYEQLKAKYAVRYPEQFNALTAAMNQLNFSEALRCCEALIKLWEAQSL